MADLEPAIVDQMRRGNHRCTALVDFRFKSKPMRVWHGFGTIRAMGVDWRGDGGLGSMSAVGVGIAGVAEEIRFRIAATEEVLTIADKEASSEETLGLPIYVWLQWFDDRPGQDWALLGAPRLYFWGTMGAPELVTEEPDDRGVRRQYLELMATNAFSLIARPPLIYWSAPDVAARCSDGLDQIADRMGDFVNGSVTWPQF